MKRWIGLALILVPVLAPAAAFWDGNAALQRGDASFEAGSFGASNSFAPDTLVFVQNLETGKTTTITITGRVSGQSDILVLLSPPAAAALGIKSGTLASVRLTIAPRTGASSASSVAEQTTTQDPDLNPSAAFGGPTQGTTSAGAAESAATTAATTATAPTATTPAAEPTPSLESLPTAQAPVAVAEAPAPSTAPEAPPEETAGTAAGTSTQTANTQTTQTTQATTPDAAAPAGPSAAELKAASDAAILADASSRNPQKKVFLPPREDKTFAYVPPAPTQTVQTATVAETPKNTTPPDTTPTTPPEPQITEAIGETGATPGPTATEDLALAEAAAPEESVPTEIVGADGAGPAAAPEAEAVALAAPEPVGEDKPPTVAEIPAPVQTEVTDPAAVPPVSPPAVVALVSPEPPAPPSETPTVVAVVPVQNQTTTQQTTAQQTQQTTTQQTTNQQTTTQQATPASRPTQSETWFVQLAAYATEKGAQDAAAKLASTYPTQVIAPATAGSRVFRVVVGPLNKAESGAVLVWFRSKGFPDAFVKQE